MSDPTAPWTGMLPVDDTALAVTDTGGPGPAVVYLNGSYAGQRHWKPVIADLGDGWRHVTYDERARGKSLRSADYSFAACLRDLDAVLRARRIERPLLVGWSYGALLAVHWAARHPDRVAGVVGVDGPYPVGWTDEADLDKLRKLFRRFGWILPLARLVGNAARMSAAKHAEIGIEAHRLHAALGPILEELTVPVRYVVASGEAFGSSGTLQQDMRRTIEPILERNPRLRIGARATGNHGTVLRKDFHVVADVVRALGAESRLSG